MSIRNIQIENFKKFGKIEIDLTHPITLIYGENSAGKSSAIKALLGLIQTFSEENNYQQWSAQGQLTDLGLYKDYIKDHDIKNRFSIAIRSQAYTPYTLKRAKVRPKYTTEQKFTYEFDKSTGQAKIYSFEESVTAQDADPVLPSIINLGVAKEDAKYQGNKYTSIKIIRPKTRSHYKMAIDRLAILSYFGDPESPHQFLLEEANGMDSAEVVFDNKFNITLSSGSHRSAYLGFSDKVYERAIVETTNFLSSFHYLGPLRMSPMRSYTLTYHTSKVGADGKLTPLVLSSIEKKAAEDRTKSKIHKARYENFKRWFGYIFPDYNIEIESHEDIVRLKVRSANRLDSISDVGFGFSQVLPILVQASAMEQGETLIVEQPELHLHPKAQVAFATFITEASKAGVKFIIETHSEHILRGLQLQISNHSLSSKDGLSGSNLNIYYFHKDARVSKMEVNEWGEIKGGWPPGFFDEGYKISSQILKNKISSMASHKSEDKNENSH